MSLLRSLLGGASATRPSGVLRPSGTPQALGRLEEGEVLGREIIDDQGRGLEEFSKPFCVAKQHCMTV